MNLGVGWGGGGASGVQGPERIPSFMFIEYSSAFLHSFNFNFEEVIKWNCVIEKKYHSGVALVLTH